MDPNANLEAQREIANRIVNGDEWSRRDAERLAELVLALDGWIHGGGFLPEAWGRDE